MPSVANIEPKSKSFIPANGVMSKIARNLVHRQLASLHTGCLQIEENGVVFSFGQVESETDLIARLIVHDVSCYGEIMTGGSIGAAESFMTGDWSSPDLTMLVRVMVRNMDILDQMEGGLALLSKPFLKTFHYFNQNSAKGSRRNIAAHYDLGNDLFELFLDPTMMYSSGIFPSAQATMEEASLNKLNIICEKLQLCADDHVVEIGTGWGGFAIYAAKNYGCKVTTTTISQEQFNLAKQRIKQEGLEDKITLLLEDYRDLRKTYKGVHSNQIGFPGGKVEETDIDLKATALRETHEEVGVSPEKVTIIKSLSEVYIPPSNFEVQPFIGLSNTLLSFEAQESEVEEIVEIRVSDFLDDSNLFSQRLSTSYAENVEVPAFRLNGHVVWGATAMMLSEIKELLNQAL